LKRQSHDTKEELTIIYIYEHSKPS